MIGSGYDLKMNNPGFTIQGGNRDNLTIRGRIPVAYWTAHYVVGVLQSTFFEPFNSSFESTYGNSLHLNPILLFPTSSREYSIAAGFAEFRFKRCKVEVQSTTATSVQVSGAICYTADGAIVGNAFDSSAEIFSYPNSVAMPGWGSREMDISRSLEAGAWYYIDMGSTSGVSNDADYRQALQGVIGGYTIGAIGVSADYRVGVIYLEYELELRGPRVNGDLVLHSPSLVRAKAQNLEREAKFVKTRLSQSDDRKRIVSALRPERKSESDEDGELIVPLESSSRNPVRVEQPSPLFPGARQPVLTVGSSSREATKAEKRS